ncbi:anaerobic benzoate catabolism transcriptional regulator [compost metagenome]
MGNFHLMKTLTYKRINAIKESTPKLVGKCIREERERQNLTQTELAEAVGKDRQYLYKIESGKVTPNIATIAILAEALGVPMNELLSIGR